MIKLKLPIFFETDETGDKKAASIPYARKECDTKEVTFYRIDALEPYEDEVDGANYTNIVCGGALYLCAMTITKVEKRIDDYFSVHN